LLLNASFLSTYVFSLIALQARLHAQLAAAACWHGHASRVDLASIWTCILSPGVFFTILLAGKTDMQTGHLLFMTCSWGSAAEHTHNKSAEQFQRKSA
jgi:hypothetical protein